MLLSRQAFVTPEFGGLGVPPTFAAVTKMTAWSMAPAPSSDEAEADAASGAGDVEITPLGEGSEWTLEQPTISDHATEPTEGLILPENEAGPGRSSVDDGWTESFDGAPNSTRSPSFEEWAKDLVIPDHLDGLDEIPWQAEYTVEGWMDASRWQVAYRIPVGPGTNALRLAVHSERTGSDGVPLIQWLCLVDSSGNMLDQITPESIEGGGGGPQLLVALEGAPEGSQLVVLLAMRDPQYPAAPGDGTGLGGDGVEGEPPPLARSIFELNIQRDDPDPPSTLGGGGEDAAGTFPAPPQPISAPLSPASGGIGILGSPQTSRLSLDELGRAEGGRNAAGLSASEFSWTAVGRMVGGRSPSVYLGPLVSRGAGPLGPTLATSDDEPTQLIDREGLVVDEALDRIGTELDSRLLAGLKHRDGSWADGAETSATGTRVIPGAGGLPVLVSATPRAREQAEVDALTANLQSQSVEEALTAEAPRTPSVTDQGSEDVKIASAGIITRAASLVLGLGLATGPLYPDLVALARRKLARGKGWSIKRRWLLRGRPVRPRPVV